MPLRWAHDLSQGLQLPVGTARILFLLQIGVVRCYVTMVYRGFADDVQLLRRFWLVRYHVMMVGDDSTRDLHVVNIRRRGGLDREQSKPSLLKGRRESPLGMQIVFLGLEKRLCQRTSRGEVESSRTAQVRLKKVL